MYILNNQIKNVTDCDLLGLLYKFVVVFNTKVVFPQAH